jgi:hypothetical protein
LKKEKYMQKKQKGNMEKNRSLGVLIDQETNEQYQELDMPSARAYMDLYAVEQETIKNNSEALMTR